MIGKSIRIFILLLTASVLTACTGTRNTETPSGMSYNMTLVAIPRTEKAVQIAFDIGKKGYPIILVAYEQVDGETQIHAWDGTTWLKVTPDAYKAGTFFDTAPIRTVLVGSDGKDAPAVLIPSSTWCQQIVRTDSDEIRSLLNFLGNGFEFTYPHWQWFAERYEFKVSEINPQYKGDKWYYHNLSDYYDRKVKGIDYDTEPEPEIEDEPVIEEMPIDEPVIEDAVIEEVELDKQVEVLENPLESEEIPAAVEVVEGTEEVEDEASMTE